MRSLVGPGAGLLQGAAVRGAPILWEGRPRPDRCQCEAWSARGRASYRERLWEGGRFRGRGALAPTGVNAKPGRPGGGPPTGSGCGRGADSVGGAPSPRSVSIRSLVGPGAGLLQGAAVGGAPISLYV